MVLTSVHLTPLQDMAKHRLKNNLLLLQSYDMNAEVRLYLTLDIKICHMVCLLQLFHLQKKYS